MALTRRRKWLLIAGGALFVVVALVVVARLQLNAWVWTRVAAALHEKYGLDVENDDVSISLLSGDAVVKGVRVKDGGKPFIEADSVELSASVMDIVGGNYDFKRFTIRGLSVHAVVETRERTNVRRIYDDRRVAPGAGDYVRFREARIEDGCYCLEDAVTDPKKTTLLALRNVSVLIVNVQISGEPRTREFGDVRLDGVVAQEGLPAKVSVVGWTRPWTGEPTFAAHGAVTGLDLAQLPQYVDASTRGWLGGDLMHLVATMRAKDGVVREGAVVGEVVATKTLLPMRFTGTVAEPVFDERSKLADVFHFGFARLGRVAVVGDIGTGAYGVGESVVDGAIDTVDAMVHLDPLGALSAAGGGVVGVGVSIGEGVVNLAKRVVGGGDSPAKSEEAAAKLEASFVEVHAMRRSAMLDAALKSARRGPAERRARIEAEIAASPAPAPPPAK